MDRKVFRDLGAGAALAMAGVAAAATVVPSPASACGGFFCSSANPVNQAAEQIIFAENGDGTVTAVIQIMYEGPASQFAWLLPVPGVPEVAVSSNQALATLQQFTNPSYQLNQSFQGCGFMNGGAAGAGGFGAPTASPDDSNGGIVEEASGAIGPYNWTVISVDMELPDPADAAIEWLGENGYDVGSLGPDVLRPYLAEGLNLLAIKLQSGSSSGSIRPIMITYESSLPSIPIRPTAVAATEDMGVLVWVLSTARAIPENYKALVLNEALIDWFNPNNNYNEVVSRAADEAMGQGFVTEYADETQTLGLTVFAPFQLQTWNDFMAQQHSDPVLMYQQAAQNWSGWDGFADSLRAAVTLPDTIDFEDFQNCMRCYITNPEVVFDTTLYLTELYQKVIKPMMDTQALLDSRPYITRLYTTMSADEMTVDPVFDFNPDLPTVSNVHVATQTMECTTGGGFNGAWTVALEQGNTVRGTEAQVWPVDIDSMPAALKIIEFGTSGQGRVLLDNTSEITDVMNDDDMMMSGGGRGGMGGSGDAGRGQAGQGGSGEAGGGGGSDGEDVTPGPDGEEAEDDDGSCSAAGGAPTGAFAPTLLALAAIALRRRKRAA